MAKETKPASDVESLEAPLLEPVDGDDVGVVVATPANFWPCTFNLTKVILGAGIMAIPKAVSLLGSALGLFMLLLVAALTWYTVHGLVYASDKTGKSTYSSLVRTAMGVLPEKALQLIMIIGCLGFEVVYLDIIGDILIGEAPAYHGIITDLIPPEHRGEWYVSRPVLLGAISILVLAPLMSMKNMNRLDAVNVIGLLSLVAFAGSTVALAIAAVVKGVAYKLPIGPDSKSLGDNLPARLTSALAVIPVVLTAASCHQSVHPLRKMLKPYNRKVLDRVVGTSLAFVTALYVVISAASYIAFGPGIKEDFLNNLNVGDMQPLLGDTGAKAVAYTVRIGYVVSLLGSAVLIMFPLREAVLELAAGAEPEHAANYFHVTTYCLLATIYAVAVFVPSIWTVISFVGSVACTVMCFIYPAILIVKYKTKCNTKHTLHRVVAWGVGALGVFLFFNGFAVFFV